MPVWGGGEGGDDIEQIWLVATQHWKRLPKHFPLIELGAFVIMPNHKHGIIITDGGARRGVASAG
jgi:hypothetical protein